MEEQSDWTQPGNQETGTVILMRRLKESRKRKQGAVQCCYLLWLGPINTSHLREWWKEWESLHKTKLYQRHNSEFPNFSFQIQPNTSQQDRRDYAVWIIQWQGDCHGNMSFVQQWSLTPARPAYLNNRFFLKTIFKIKLVTDYGPESSVSGMGFILDFSLFEILFLIYSLTEFRKETQHLILFMNRHNFFRLGASEHRADVKNSPQWI